MMFIRSRRGCSHRAKLRYDIQRHARIPPRHQWYTIRKNLDDWKNAKFCKMKKTWNLFLQSSLTLRCLSQPWTRRLFFFFPKLLGGSAPPPPASMMRKNRPLNFSLSKILQKIFSREHEKSQKRFSQKLRIIDAGGGGVSVARGFVIFSRADASDIFKVFTGCDKYR